MAVGSSLVARSNNNNASDGGWTPHTPYSGLAAVDVISEFSLKSISVAIDLL